MHWDSSNKFDEYTEDVRAFMENLKEQRYTKRKYMVLLYKMYKLFKLKHSLWHSGETDIYVVSISLLLFVRMQIWTNNHSLLARFRNVIRDKMKYV